MICGLFETHINVTDLARSMEFCGSVLGLELGRKEEARRVSFYWLGSRGNRRERVILPDMANASA